MLRVVLRLLSSQACFPEKMRSPASIALNLTRRFRGHQPFWIAEKEFMFLISTFTPKGSFWSRARTEISIAAQGPFLHVAVADAQITQ